MDELITIVNHWGGRLVEHAGLMLVQSGILIVMLLAIDRMLNRHIRASVRYYIWMLVLIKLVLSPHLSLPISVGNWIQSHPANPLMTLLNLEQDVPFQVSQETKQLIASETEPTSIDIGEGGPGKIQLTWRGVALLVWFAGILTLSLGLGYRARSIYRIIQCAEKPDDLLLQVLADAKREMKIRMHIGLRLTLGVSGPAVCRFWRPVILLPKVLADRFQEDDIRTVILHELCHIKRADPWINWAQTLIQIFYFYNPMVWLANTCIRRVREQAVDEGVLVCMKGRLKSYSHTLIDVAEAVTLRPGLGVGLIGVAESKTQLNKRIHLMLNKPIPKHTRLGTARLLVIVMIGILILPMAATQTRANKIELPEPGTGHVRDEDNLPTPEEIIEKNLEVTGGKEAHEKIRNRKEEFNVRMASDGMEYKVVFYRELGNKHLVLANNDAFGELKYGSDGSVVWEISPFTGTRILEGEERATRLLQYALNQVAAWNTPGNNVITEGIEDVNGSPCYKIVITPKEGSPIEVYFDKESFLPVKYVAEVKQQNETLRLESFPEDYRKAGEVLEPYKTKVFSKGQLFQIVTYEHIEHNTEMPEGIFGLPEEIEHLLLTKRESGIVLLCHISILV